MHTVSLSKEYSMKQLFLLLASSALLSAPSFAKDASDNDFKKNHVKLNLFSLPLKTISLQYERGLAPKISVSLGVRFQPSTNLPFKSSFVKAADDDTIATSIINETQISNWAITPEFRYYFGKKPLQGFYVAPFARIGGYSFKTSYSYEEDNGKTRVIPLEGNATSITGGLLLGAQWHIGKVLIDWWILGPSYGSTNIKLTSNTDLSTQSPSDRQQLIKDLNEFSISGRKFESEVDDNGVRTKGSLPALGIRTGLCIGFCF